MKKKLTVTDAMSAARQHEQGLTLDTIKAFFLPDVSRQTIWRAVREVRAAEARIKLAMDRKHPGLLTLGETIIALRILDSQPKETEADDASTSD
jgi:hypothetical protein